MIRTRSIKTRTTGRAADLYKTERSISEYQSARYLLEQAFGKEELEKLLQRASQKRKGYSLRVFGWQVL